MSFSGRSNFGLPSTPRARTFTAGPVRQDIPPRPRSSASERPPRPPPSAYAAPPVPALPRSIRPQRSLNALPSAPPASYRSRLLERSASRHVSHVSTRSEPPAPPPPLPGLSAPRRTHREFDQVSPRKEDYRNRHAPTRSVDQYAPRRSDELMSDSSSSGRSEMSMSPHSVASSRTSLDEAEGEDKAYGKPEAGPGSSLWTSLTSVASNLTINVSKAWQSKIAVYSGEETPEGGESRLTRAMKAYHIEKARDPADLPDWLFDERERGVRTHQPSTSTPGRERERESNAPQPRPAGLSRSATTRQREAAPSARIARGPTLADRRGGSASGGGGQEHVTKSIARLRALRDAKRSAKVRFNGDEDGDEDAGGQEQLPPAYAPAPMPLPVSAPAPLSRQVPVARESPMRPRANMPPPLGALGGRGRQPSTRVGLPSGVRPVRA
ncbi:hypothetical protein BD413DRAFT_18045 [Trametes elegans]|nr:hypothetical protein BD413DRAFT_18045 [Trametes elegans]